MARIARVSHSAPYNQVNITPLIDVMLVLLVVIILTLPSATHKVPIDLPVSTRGPVDPAPPQLLSIDRAGGLAWDGARIGDAELPGRLAGLLKAGAPLHLATDPEARYERFDQVLAMVKRAGVTRLGFVGNRPLED